MSAKLIELIEEYDLIDGSEISHLKEELEAVQAEQDAHIAELTAKYDSLEKSWTEGSGAHEESIAEASRYRVALEGIVMLNGGHRSETNSLLNDAQDIARNALKDGM